MHGRILHVVVVLCQQFFQRDSHHAMTRKGGAGVGVQGGGSESDVNGTDLEECRKIGQTATGKGVPKHHQPSCVMAVIELHIMADIRH